MLSVHQYRYPQLASIFSFYVAMSFASEVYPRRATQAQRKIPLARQGVDIFYGHGNSRILL